MPTGTIGRHHTFTVRGLRRRQRNRASNSRSLHAAQICTRPGGHFPRSFSPVAATVRSCRSRPSHGPNPTIPAPTKTLIPTVNVAKATGWPEGAKPKAANGLTVNAFANGLDHPRWVYVLPNGDVLVAESNAPPKPAAGHQRLDPGHGAVVGRRRRRRAPTASRCCATRTATASPKQDGLSRRI